MDKNAGVMFKYLFLEPKLQVYHLNFNDNQLCDQGFESILEAIKNSASNNIRVIRANSNQLTSLCTIRLAHILKRKKGRLPPIKIQILTLRNNNLGNLGVETISTFLKQNNTIKYLDLAFNNLENNALQAISDALKVNDCIRYLNLLGSNFNDRGILSLTNALMHNYGEKEHTKLMILKLGDIHCNEDIFQQFILDGIVS